MPEESKDDWTIEARWLKDKGLVTGYSDGTFRPFVQMNRGQMAIALKALYDLIEKEFAKKP